MDKKFIIANWKMNLRSSESAELAVALAKDVQILPSDMDLVLCPSFESLAVVAAAVKNTKILLGAQNCFWEDEGAFTGEVSPKFLHELGCGYVILGHSERRQNLGETNQQINKKIKTALANGLKPILCIGETFAERQEGQKDFVIMKQLEECLSGIKLIATDQLLVAYEPVWVIGSGQAVAPDEAEHTSRVIRQSFIDLFGLETANKNVGILYGGSVNENNFKNFLDQPSINGVLVGTASLDARVFQAIIKSAS